MADTRPSPFDRERQEKEEPVPDPEGAPARQEESAP